MCYGCSTVVELAPHNQKVISSNPSAELNFFLCLSFTIFFSKSSDECSVESLSGRCFYLSLTRSKATKGLFKQRTRWHSSNAETRLRKRKKNIELTIVGRIEKVFGGFCIEGQFETSCFCQLGTYSTELFYKLCFLTLESAAKVLIDFVTVWVRWHRSIKGAFRQRHFYSWQTW